MATRRKTNLAKGKTRTKTITRGPNKGDRVVFKGSPSGKPFPTRVITDKGGNSTLRGDVPIGKKPKKSKAKRK
jgi:hypothetical protein